MNYILSEEEYQAIQRKAEIELAEINKHKMEIGHAPMLRFITEVLDVVVKTNLPDYKRQPIIEALTGGVHRHFHIEVPK